MRKTLNIFLHEYLKHVRRRRFLVTLLSMPLIIALGILVGWLVTASRFDVSPLGYVDLSGFLPAAGSAAGDELARSEEYAIPILPFTGEQEAIQALQKREIQAYYVLPEDYLQSGEVQLVSIEPPSEEVRDEFEEFIRARLAAALDEPLARRLLQGSHILIQNADGTRSTADNQLWNILLPILGGLFFVMAVNICSGYLLQAVVEEKENRTIEILVSSVSPLQLMGGKIFGNISVGLTILFCWLVFGIAAIAIVRIFFFPAMRVDIDMGMLLLVLSAFFPAFVMIASWMTALGATVTEIREAQQISGFISMLVLVPFWFSSQLFFEPNSALAVFLSLFPVTAPVALTFRGISASIPLWQMALSLALLYASAVASVWLAARAFRMGMLVYGRRLSLKDILKRTER